MTLRGLQQHLRTCIETQTFISKTTEKVSTNISITETNTEENVEY